ncbi:MAG: TolC family protein [Prevotellaceae bacterium]|jgi:outer membrane protein|nr:TolC family protein [Prevotellaceae bacterium]
MKKKISLAILAILATTGIHAQEAWSLGDCISYAITNNIQIKRQELNAIQEKNSLLQSKLNLLPSISGSGSYGINWGRSLDITTNQYVETRNQSANLSASASATLFAGLQKQNAIKRNELNYQAATQDVEKLRNDISLNIAGAYLQILLDEERLLIAEEQLKTTTEQLAKTKILVDAGSVTMSAYLDLQAQRATEEVEVVVAKNNIAVSYLNLKQLLDIQTDDSFKIENPEIEVLPEVRRISDVNQIFEQNSALRPEVKSAEYRLLSARKQLSIAKGADYPGLSIGGGFTTQYSEAAPNSFSDQIRNNYYYNFSLRLSVPIFNGWQTRTAIRNTKLNVRNAELQLQQTKNNLYKEIQQAEVDAEAALQRYHASQKNVTALQESFRYVEQKFNVGMVNTTDYNIAKKNLARAQSELAQSKYQFIFQSKILDFYQGIPLSL